VITVADRRRLAAYYSKHCRRAFQRYQHRWPWTTLDSKIGVFSEFFSDFRLQYTFEDWIAPKPFKIDQDNLRVKCSALNVDFNGVRFDPLSSRSPLYERSKFGYPLENVRFLLLSTNLARQWLQIDRDLLLIITTTADELSGGTNIDDLERPWTPKIGVLSDFFASLGCDAHLRVNFRWNILEIDQDNLRTKLNWCCGASHEHSLRFLVTLDEPIVVK